jgi:hypothetical protein
MITRPSRRDPFRFGTGLVVGCLVAWAAPAAEEPNQPITTVSVPVSLPPARPSPVKPIAQRITLTEEEKTVLDDLQDRTDQFDEAPLYVMFAVAARAPHLEPIDWHDLDQPAYVNVVADPNRYRAAPLRMEVKVFQVSKLQAGAGLSFRPGIWPGNRPVWRMDCLQTDTPYEKNKPLRVYSVVDPEPYIGQEDEKDSHNIRSYNRGRRVRIAALFFKLYRTREEQSGELRDYPELIAWQIGRTVSSLRDSGGVGGLAHFLPLLLLIVALAAGFYFTRRRLAKLKQDSAGLGARYRPLRYQAEGPSGDDRGRQGPDGREQVDGPVDPDLAAAAEEFLREHEEERDDARDGEDRWR